MRPIEALYQDGVLKPAKPLSLRPGEHVGVIVVRRPEQARWDLTRLAEASSEDVDLAEAGLDEWADDLDAQDRS
jgi:predicted DNA-binding antitoxin AbrB/MazE fold protein